MDWSYLAGFVDGEGSICLSRGGSYRYKNVPGYAFQAQGFCIELLLRSIEPYLIIKKRQAEVAIAFIERRKQQRDLGSRTSSIT